MITSVVRCSNDVVMVFDEEGEQVPEYQGYYSDVRANILRDTPPGTAFSYFLDAVSGFKDVSREEW